MVDLDLVVVGVLERVEDRFDLVVVLGRLVLFEDRVLVVGLDVELLLVVDLVLGRVVALLRVVDLVFGREVALLRGVYRVFERVLTPFRFVALRILRLLKLEFLYLPPLCPLIYE